MYGRQTVSWGQHAEHFYDFFPFVDLKVKAQHNPYLFECAVLEVPGLKLTQKIGQVQGAGWEDFDEGVLNDVLQKSLDKGFFIAAEEGASSASL